jgi:hypothetical protein
MCSCEQWADQSRNIKTRANREQGDQYLGFDWSEQCEPIAEGTMSCPNPHNPSQRLSVARSHYERFRAQVLNDATGWDFVENVPYAESEPTDPTEIKGNFTHEELPARLGYTVVVPIGMTNDYNGYIASYREYQRGDHYRKALTGWGPHSMDYMSTRLVQLGGHLKQRLGAVLPTEPEREQADAMGSVKTETDMAHNDARTFALGRLAEGAVAAYEASLPDDGGSPAVLVQPAPVERFGATFLRWRGGSNYTDDPVVRVQREVEGQWADYADMSGEVPVTLKFPRVDGGDLPAYATGSYEWEWTATFEAFVSSFDTGVRPLATPAGRYRFVVDGRRRTGRTVQPYHLESEAFEVLPYDGITAEDVRIEADRTVSLRVGPRRVLQVPGDPPVSDEIGPIDYPDSYGGDLKARFIREQRTALRDPADRANPDLLEWFCFTCTFRPWIDAGDAETVKVTIRRVSGSTVTVAAVRHGDRWRTTTKLRPGESAHVAAGGIRDPWGNLNGAPSASVTVPR